MLNKPLERVGYFVILYTYRGNVGMFVINNPLITALKKDLDVGMLRQRVIANNLANINTPGFKKSYVSFEEQLQSALGKNRLPLRTTRPQHLGGLNHPADVNPKVVQVNNTSLNPDGNNVNADEEMVNLAANQVKYNASAQMIDGTYSSIRHVISSSRR